MQKIPTRYIKKYKTKVYIDESNRKCVKHFDTVVFILDSENNTITLNSGGYRSRTTKDRIHSAFKEFGIRNTRIFQENWEWFVDHGQNPRIPFVDGMTLQFFSYNEY